MQRLLLFAVPGVALSGLFVFFASGCGAFLTDLQGPVDASDTGAPPPSNDAGIDTADAAISTDPIIALSAGTVVACALHASRKVSCWGDNSLGAVGVPISKGEKCGDADCRPTPITVEGLANVEQVSAGNNYACALRTDGKVLCWGDNKNGVLGVPRQNLASTEVPKIIDGVPAAVEIATGASSVCARTEGAEPGVYCWGSNEFGLRGEPSTATTGAPVKIPGLGATKAIALGANGGTACVILPDDNVSCWGRSDLGVAGRSPGDDPQCVNEDRCSATPIAISPKLTVAQIRMGSQHACARTLGGKVQCWGANGWGQLGRGSADFDPHPVPAFAGELAGVTALSIGESHVCALAGDGLQCWGSNAFGELGSGFGGENCQFGSRCRTLPTMAAAVVRAASQVGAGAGFTIALQGDLYSWGANDFGQLGHRPGTSSDSERSCSGEHTCNPNPQPVGSD